MSRKAVLYNMKTTYWRGPPFGGRWVGKYEPVGYQMAAGGFAVAGRYQ